MGSVNARLISSAEDSDGMISRRRPGRMTNAWRWRWLPWSRVENMPKPPPDHGLSDADCTRAIWCKATMIKSAIGSVQRARSRVLACVNDAFADQ